VGDVLDPPGAAAQQEDVADPRLVDHLLVELADAGALVADQEDAEHAAVGMVPPAGDGQPLRTRSPGERAGHAVPGDARPQLGEVVAGVAAGQHVQHRLEARLRQRRERAARRHDRRQVVDLPALQRAHRDDLLGQHVERVARVGGRLDAAVDHPLGDDRALHEVAAVLRQDDPAADAPDLVAGAADALQAAGDRRAATRPARRGRPRPCRCRARGWRSRRRPAAAGLQRLLDRATAARGRPSRGGARAISTMPGASAAVPLP
jgi:hypothetical protein